jgi:ribosomal protein L14E/L6E/L27E
MEIKKRTWINAMASQLSFKNRTFGHLIKKKSGLKIENKLNFEKSSRKKNKKTFSNLKPGSVLILLSQKLLGKKVILINTTESGLLVVTGPFSLNGISLRRVNKKYTIQSGAELSVENFNSPTLILNSRLFNDEYFETLAKSKSKSFDHKKHNFVISHRIRQNYIDKFIHEFLKKNFFLKAYLRTRKPLLFSN